MKARTMGVARQAARRGGQAEGLVRRGAVGGDRELFRVTAEQEPGSLDRSRLGRRKA